jgi:hypothetical protein
MLFRLLLLHNHHCFGIKSPKRTVTFVSLYIRIFISEIPRSGLFPALAHTQTVHTVLTSRATFQHIPSFSHQPLLANYLRSSSPFQAILRVQQSTSLNQASRQILPTAYSRHIITMDRSVKRQRIEEPDALAPESLQRSISPPRKRNKQSATIKSPWQLTWIQDLPESDNKDAVSLRDLLGDPLISECWEFNFLHDIPFLMNAFDPDTRHLVKVHVVHGFWKREDENRIALEVR